MKYAKDFINKTQVYDEESFKLEYITDAEQIKYFDQNGTCETCNVSEF